MTKHEDAIKRKQIEEYGKLCSHGSVPSLGHDCVYTSARNRLIPVAEQLAATRAKRLHDGSINKSSYSQEFLAAMDELWRTRHYSEDIAMPAAMMVAAANTQEREREAG